MKKISLTITLVALLIGCSNQAKESQTGSPPLTADKAPVTVTKPVCTPKPEDPFYCNQVACQSAGGAFDLNAKICSCPKGQIFWAQGQSCLKGSYNDKGSVLQFPVAERTFLFQVLDNQGTEIDLDEIVRRHSPTVFPGRASIRLASPRYLTALEPEFFQDGFPLGFATTELDDATINQGISSQVLRDSSHIFFLPTTQPVAIQHLPRVTPEIAQLLQKALAPDLSLKSRPSIRSFTENGCAEICLETTELLKSPTFKIERLRIFSGGNPLSDIVRVFDSASLTYPIAVTLFDQSISHFFIAAPRGGYDIYANDGTLILSLNQEEKNRPPSRALISTPVALFEGQYNDQADSVAVFGPHLQTSYYGWFTAESGRPYYYGKSPSLLGEEDLTSREHSQIVSSVASQNYAKALLPMSITSLLNGDFSQVAAQYQKKFVASLSFSFTFDSKTCRQSPFAKSIADSENQILWVVAAGNSGSAYDISQISFCPQSLPAKNILIVAATSGDLHRLSSSSSFGENYADLATNGCVDEKRCDSPATSFAAPRLARLAADLLTEFPDQSISEIKMSLLLTAYVPTLADYDSLEINYLPVKSGGLADAKAARALLQAGGISAPDLLKRLMRIRKTQYRSLTNEQISELTKAHFERIQNKYGDTFNEK